MAGSDTVTPHAMTPLQAVAYARPWSNSSPDRAPPLDRLPSGEVIGLSINL